MGPRQAWMSRTGTRPPAGRLRKGHARRPLPIRRYAPPFTHRAAFLFSLARDGHPTRAGSKHAPSRETGSRTRDAEPTGEPRLYR